MSDKENMSEDLEEMIDEAEKEAQIESDQPIEEPVSTDAETVEVTDDTVEEKKELSKARLIYRKILVWLVVIAVAFAGGFFTDSVLRYQPEKAKTDRLSEELDNKGEVITNLEEEINRLSLFEDKNEVLLEERNQMETHLTLLSARTTVADAQLAIEQDRQADAKVALDKLGTTLETLKTLVNSEQAEVVENMMQRQELIIPELDGDSFSALSDLGVLAARLSVLENTLFATP